MTVADVVRFLDNDDVAELLEMPALISMLEAVYADMARGEAITGPVVTTHAPTAAADEFHRLKTMGGAIPRLGVQGLRIDSDRLRWPTVDGAVQREYVNRTNREELRVGAENGLVITYDIETGEPLLLAPDGRMQRRRVGATSALAADYLARDDASSVGILGSGWQAGGQLLALSVVRDLDRVDVYSPTREHRESFVTSIGARIDAEVRAVETAEAAVDGKDVVNAATDSLTPVIDPSWLEPGVHVSCVKRHEITPESFDAADVVVLHSTDEVDQTAVFPETPPRPATGESDRWWRDPDADFWADIHSLPELCAGAVPGRQADADSTVFVNNLGLGIQFAVCGSLLAEAAERAGAGHELPIDWFLQSVASE